MTENFRPDLITKDIDYCLIEQCPQAPTCLRYLAYKHSSPFSTHSFVDPRRLAQQAPCPHYLSNQIQHSAKGFKHAMNMLPKNKVMPFQAHVREAFGWSRSRFYRYSAGEHPIFLEKQTIIRQIFAEFGLTLADPFDAYEEMYDLS